MCKVREDPSNNVEQRYYTKHQAPSATLEKMTHAAVNRVDVDTAPFEDPVDPGEDVPVDEAP